LQPSGSWRPTLLHSRHRPSGETNEVVSRQEKVIERMCSTKVEQGLENLKAQKGFERGSRAGTEGAKIQRGCKMRALAMSIMIQGAMGSEKTQGNTLDPVVLSKYAERTQGVWCDMHTMTSVKSWSIWGVRCGAGKMRGVGQRQ